MSEQEGGGSRARAKPLSVRGLAALWFVVAALVALVAVPVYLGERAEVAQARISEVLDPARSVASRIALLQARQMARFQNFLLTGDRVLRRQYIDAIAEEDSLFAQLQALSRSLDFDVRERLAELHTETTSWHVENQRVFNADSIGGAYDVSRSTYSALERESRELSRAIQSEVDDGRRAMARVRTLQTQLSFGLALLALGATVVVGGVGWRFRDLSTEAENRRRDAVRARREIDALLEATGDGVLGIDLDGKCTSLNPAGVELLGYGAREIEGRDVHDTLFHSYPDGTTRPREDSPVLAAVAEGRAVDSPDGAVLWRRRRRSFPARWSLRPLLDGIELRGAVLTFTDMTEIQEKEEALRRAIQQREDLVSIVSHDLRNPLGVVLAASDLLVELPLNEDERRRQAEIIGRSGRRMQRLIEDLLDIARIEAGAFVMRTSLEDLTPIVDEARKVFADQAEQRGVRLRVEKCPGAPRARIDRDRILQALANLLDNALRLTPAGGSVVLGVAGQNGYVHLTVADDGPGIEPDSLEKLFDRFAQAGGDGGGGGAGLGLTIVKGIAEAHGGDVAVRSEVGCGSTFTIRLPSA